MDYKNPNQIARIWTSTARICPTQFHYIQYNFSDSTTDGSFTVVESYRKEGNDQESIQLPNTFDSKTPKGKKDAFKATAPQSKHYKQKAKRIVSFPKID